MSLKTFFVIRTDSDYPDDPDILLQIDAPSQALVHQWICDNWASLKFLDPIEKPELTYRALWALSKHNIGIVEKNCEIVTINQ
jgi:hypothetical protein